MIDAREAKQKADIKNKSIEKVTKIIDFVSDLIRSEANKGDYHCYLSIKQLSNLNDIQINVVLNTLREHGYEVIEYHGDNMEPGITGYKIMWK